METEKTERDLKEESTGLAVDWKERGEQGGDKGDARLQWLMPGRTIMTVTGATSPGRHPGFTRLS